MLEQVRHDRTANKPCASKESYVMAVAAAGEGRGARFRHPLKCGLCNLFAKRNE